MKAFLDFLTLPLNLPINPIWDVVICLVIGEIAYRVAYAFAGAYADTSGGRTVLHWLIRIPLWFLIWLFACLVITIVNLVRQNCLWLLAILGALVLCGGTVVFIRSRVARRNGSIRRNQAKR